MDNLQMRFVFDRKKQASDTKTGLLQIEVRLQKTNKAVFISTGIHLYKNQFSDRGGFTCRNHNNSALITGKAVRLYRQIEAYCLSEMCKHISDVKNWDRCGSDSYSFIDFMKSDLAKNNPSFATMEHHNVLIRQIESFGRINAFSDVNYKNIYDFDLHLKKTIRSHATLNKRHSTLHKYIKKAIALDLLSKDPYMLFKMPTRKSREPTYLEDFEIKKIMGYEPLNDKLCHVKDLFIIQCFTGLSYIDLSQFDSSCIHIIDGKKVLKSNRQKTDESFISLLLPEAESILNKYAYNLPKISNQKYNDYLKLLGAGAGINKNLTTHVARHTYATYLLNKGIPIETVSRAMGHSNIKMTQHYAKLLAKKVISDMEVLLS